MEHTVLTRLTALVAAGALAVASCGSDDDSDSSLDATSEERADGVPSVATVAPSGTGLGSDTDDGGWVGGEPEWSGGADTMSGSASEPAEERTEAAADSVDDMSVVTPAAGEREVLVEGDIEAPPVDGSPLRAGSVDDNVDYDGFVDYLDRVAGLGITARPFDGVDRSVVTVTDDAGRAVAGALVEVTAGERDVARLRTTADGTARFFPSLYDVDADAAVTFAVEGGSSVDALGGSDVRLSAPAVAIGETVPLDVLFLLDATGSMGDEIDRLKATIDTVAERISGLDPRPDVRFAMTLYRDVGDAFVSSTFDFTNDVATFRAALADVVADGGGDYPEALDEGLAAALAEPGWRDPADAVQLVFVVADAPPQVSRQVETPYTRSIVEAVERGIKIFPVASSESDDVAELVFRQLAVATGAPFVFLSYGAGGAGGAATGPSTDITTTDYEELALDELVVRLIAEELADLAGPDAPPPTVPPTVPPATTIPDPQQQPSTTIADS